MMPSAVDVLEMCESGTKTWKTSEAAFKVRFRVSPVDMKMRYYKDLGGIPKDYNRKEIEDAHIDVIYGAVVVGQINTEKLLDELY